MFIWFILVFIVIWLIPVLHYSIENYNIYRTFDLKRDIRTGGIFYIPILGFGLWFSFLVDYLRSKRHDD